MFKIKIYFISLTNGEYTYRSFHLNGSVNYRNETVETREMKNWDVSFEENDVKK